MERVWPSICGYLACDLGVLHLLCYYDAVTRERVLSESPRTSMSGCRMSVRDLVEGLIDV